MLYFSTWFLLLFKPCSIGCIGLKSQPLLLTEIVMLILLSLAVATVSLEESSYTVDEDDGVVEVCAELIDGDLETDISVCLSTMDDSAVGEYISLERKTLF